MRKALKRVLQKVPPELSNDPDVKYLLGEQDGGGTTVVHLIYQRRGYESSTMDYEFSRITMEDHWRAGYDDAKETLACGQWVNRRIPEEGFKTIDRRRVANGK